jgi:biopolymer transport protein ExbD
MRRKLAKTRLSSDMSLQITSMADIFTIILVFLLKSHATSAIDISPSKGMRLPVGQDNQSVLSLEEALKIEISENAVQLEGKPVIPLSGFRVIKDGAADQKFGSLNESLAREREREKLISEKNLDVKVSSKILIVADQRTPYSTLKSVLLSAASHGYTDYKLVVVNRE